MTAKTEGRSNSSPDFTDLLDEPAYRTLVRRAASLLRYEAPGHQFEPADLVHEAILRIARSAVPVRFQNTNHLFMVVAIVMRRILIDYARVISHSCVHVPLDPDERLSVESCAEALCLRDALARLANYENRLFRIVEMRVFKGFNTNEIASALDLSSRTIKRDWNTARKWLQGLFVSVPAGLAPSNRPKKKRR